MVYGKYLSRDLINLFTGIEGRIIEKYFVTSSKNNYELIKNAIVKDDSKLLNIPHYEKYLGKEKFKEFYSLPAFRSGFDETEFKNVIFNGCYPLNPIAAYLLLNISEKVAQNERTLFTFISNDEPHSMARFVSEHTLDKEWSIGADLIYEYFSALFKKDVVNEFIHNIWLSAEYAIDKCDTEDQRKIVKALAVILIVNKEDEIPATEKYLKLCINASDPEQALMELKKKEFIYKKNSTDSYVFKTRAGSELKAEIKRQRELKGENVNYSKVLLDVTGNYFIIPRKYNTVKMMTRYFTNEFMSVDDFLNITSSTALLDNTLDGKVITLYSFSRIKQEAVKQHLLELAEKRLVVICPKKGLKAKKQLKDYEIISDLKGNQVFTNNNEILKRELPLLLDDLTTELEIIIGDVYEDDLDTKVLYFDGGRIKNAKSGNVEKAVNECCLNVYTSTPIINNEMVNRAEIGTAQTKKARLNIVQAILSHTDTPEFYRGSNQEATIYRSLFCVTGIVDGDIREDIQLVIDEINRYIDSCCDKKVSVKGMVYKLVKAPYGMRAGVIPFYLAYVLANRREDIIVYFSNKEVYGPFGIGGFINVSGIKLNTFITGGTGSDSLNLDMPSGNESKYESASANIVAIAGLNAALESLDQRKCYEHEKELTKYLIERLSNNKKVKMYLPNDLENHIGIVSLTVDGFSSEDIGIILDEDFDIAVRTGYHCAPYIHKYLKDETQLGTVRVGIGQFNTKKEIDLFVKAIEEIVYE